FAALTTVYSPANLEAQLDEVVEAIRATDARDDAILIAPVNALGFTPLIQPGAFLWALEQDPTSRPILRAQGKTVSDDCSPLLNGRNLVSIRVALNPGFSTISCASTAPGVISQAEIATYLGWLAQVKAAIQERAQANGWIYIDMDVEFAEAL